MNIDIQPLPHRDPHIAGAIHAIHMVAYAQEARTLGATLFPPLERSVQDIASSPERFLGAWSAGRLVGALGLEHGFADDAIEIASLVVLPEWQRRGIGRRLVAAALAGYENVPAKVSTGAKNGPALALYVRFGFVEASRRFVGPERLEVIGLVRPPGPRTAP